MHSLFLCLALLSSQVNSNVNVTVIYKTTKMRVEICVYILKLIRRRGRAFATFLSLSLTVIIIMA